MPMLKLADTLKLPVDAATQTFAFIARKGAGKTYAAGKLVELLLDAGVQVVVLDTVGNWYGLRLSADGKSAGFDIPVLGGLRGDIPLEAAGGALIADIVVDTGRSVVLDVSQFSLADRKRFATSFGERLWQAKKGEKHPSPLHLVIEESQLIVPQFTGTGGDIARMLGIYEEIIRLGRNYGIGVSMITQRPQSVNKEVLNQTECLFVGQVNGAQERDALKKWITHQGMDVHLVDELPSLKVGTFYVWSPQWLNILERVQILAKKTLDASATPKVGDKRVRREMKPLDLADLQERLKATIEKQKADDPRELRKQIAELQRQVSKGAHIMRTESAPPKVVEKPVVTDGQLSRLDMFITRLEGAVTRAGSVLQKPMADVSGSIEQLAAAVRSIRQQPQLPMPAPRTMPLTSSTPREVVRPRKSSNNDVRAESDDAITPARQKILNALAFFEGVGLSPVDKTQLALMVGVTPTSGGYKNNLGTLRSGGSIDYPTPGTVALTDVGRAVSVVDGVPQTTLELHAALREKLPPAKWKILDILINAYPGAIDKEQLAQACDVPASSGGYKNNLGALRSLGLLDYPQPGLVQAQPVLFLEGR